MPSAPDIARNCTALQQENDRLRQEVDSLKGKLEAIREIEEEESEESNGESLPEESIPTATAIPAGSPAEISPFPAGNYEFAKSRIGNLLTAPRESSEYLKNLILTL